MRIGDCEISNCNECPAYDWAGESIYKGDHGMRCNFGAFHSEYPEYGEKLPIPDNCPIKSSDITEQYENQTIKCYTCGWEGKQKELILRNNLLCPDCECDIEE